MPTLPLAFQAAYGLCKGFDKRRASVNVSDAFGFAAYRGACELAALRTSSNKRTLFPEKRTLRSAGRRGMGSSIKHL